MSPRESAGRELDVYLRTLAGDCGPDRSLDIRWARPRAPMRRRFIAVNELARAAALIRRVSARADVYVGAAPREGRTYGGKRAVEHSHVAFVDCDSPRSRALVAGFRNPPTMVVSSGTPGHVHLYWRLDRCARRAQLERANRRLARALGGDLACADIARVLRPPQTLNHKHDAPRATRLIAHREHARYDLGALVAGLEDPVEAGKPPSDWSDLPQRRTACDRELLSIAGSDYARDLVRREPDRAGKIACPFHDDRHPSLQLYGDGSFYCFGCRRGGTIYDFAAQLWGMDTRGAQFLALRARLRATFGLEHRRAG